jgi:hypothetical protein
LLKLVNALPHPYERGFGRFSGIGSLFGRPLLALVRLRHPQDGWQQIGGQFCLADNIIRASGHRRLPVHAALQQGHSDDAHTRQHLPQAGDGLQARLVQVDQNHLWLQVLSLGQGPLVPTDRADGDQLVVSLQSTGCSAQDWLAQQTNSRPPAGIGGRLSTFQATLLGELRMR